MPHRALDEILIYIGKQTIPLLLESLWVLLALQLDPYILSFLPLPFLDPLSLDPLRLYQLCQTAEEAEICFTVQQWMLDHFLYTSLEFY